MAHRGATLARRPIARARCGSRTRASHRGCRCRIGCWDCAIDAGQSGFQRFAGSFAADPADRAAPGQRAVRSVRRLCLLADPARLRPPETFRSSGGRARSAPAELASQLSLPADATVRLLDAAVVAESGAAPQRRPLRAGSARRGPARQSRRRRHDRASRDALRRPAAIRSRCCAAKPAQDSSPRIGPTRGAARPPSSPSEAIAPYTALMAASQPMIAQQVLSAYSFRRHRCLLDIGGGDGAFIARGRGARPETALRAVRSARGRRPGQRAVSQRRACPPARSRSAAAFSPTGCRRAPISSRWCG